MMYRVAGFLGAAGVAGYALTQPAGSLAAEKPKSKEKVVKLTKDDMLPNIGYVPAGVVEIIARQRQGWAVLRP